MGRPVPWREQFHSRMVAWLKILLPLAALAILSTLFLLSKNPDPTTAIPFTTIDIRERAREQQITEPEFAGATEDGDLITFHAASVRPDPDGGSRATARDLSARIDLVSGTEITFRAADGSVDEAADRVELLGDVLLTSSTGYVVTTDRLIAGMREIRAQSPGPVHGYGPPGRFTAGRMLLTSAPDTDGKPAIHLLFTDGVKLVYDPAEDRN